MEKKEYVTPEIQVYKIEVQAPLLEDSININGQGASVYDGEEELFDF